MDTRIVAAALAAAALVVPTAAVADSGHRKSVEKKAAKKETKAKHKGKNAKKVTFVFRGTFTAPGTVDVVAGNAHVRKGGFVGHQVTFDFASARVVVADTNADQKVDLTDVKDGDLVLIQARAIKGTEYAAPAEGETAAPIVARNVIDKTNSPAEGDDEVPAA
jgi:hypothetical protein